MKSALTLGGFLALVTSAAWGAEPTAKEWVRQYAKLGGVAVLHDDDTALHVQKNEDQKPLVSLKGLPAPSGVRRVVLHGFEVTDEDAAALANWKNLQEVLLVDVKRMSDDGVRPLAKLSKLRRLELADTSVTGSGIGAFSGHGTLAELIVTNTIIENKVVSVDLRNVPELESLLLNCVGLKRVALSALPKLKVLPEFPLEVEEATICDAGALTELDFRGTRLAKLVLAGVPKLETLDVRKTHLDAGSEADLRRAFPGVKIRR